MTISNSDYLFHGDWSSFHTGNDIFFHNNQFHDHPNTALLGPGGASGGGSQRKLSCPEKVCFLSVWQAAGWVGVGPGQFAPQIQRSWALIR